MFQNRLMLGLMTGSISFGLSLLILRDFQRAAFTGLMGFVGSQAAALVIAGQSDSRLSQRQDELRQNIRTLQRKRAEAYEALMQIRREQETVQLNGVPYSNPATATPTARPSQSNPWQPAVAASKGRSSSAIQPLPLSWNLAQPKPAPVEMEVNGLETRVKTLSQEEESLQQSLNQTLSAKQKAELHLTTSKAELNQIQTRIAEQERQKQTLAQSVSNMEQQRQQLHHDLDALQTQVQTLEKSRTELSLFLQGSEPNRPKSDHASKSLQTAIEQMQSQITSLHGELGELEAQILQRRSEKEQLDQTIAQLQQQKPQPQKPQINATPKPDPQSNQSQPIKAFAPKPQLPANKLDNSELAAEWLSLKQSLQAHEYQALRSIAIDANPVIALKRLAEENLTMPEMLIDTINERALETIGDLILETGSDAASTIIAQEYREPVATLISKYSQ